MLHFLGFLGVFVWWATEARWDGAAQIPDGPGMAELATDPNGGDVTTKHSSRLWLLIYPPSGWWCSYFPFSSFGGICSIAKTKSRHRPERFDSKHGWLFMPSSTGFMSAVVEYWCFIKLKIFNFERCNSRFEREDHRFPIASMGLVYVSDLLVYQLTININHPCIYVGKYTVRPLDGNGFVWILVFHKILEVHGWKP